MFVHDLNQFVTLQLLEETPAVLSLVKLWEDPVVLLERNLYGHPLAGQTKERQFEETYKYLDGKKGPSWKCWFVHRKQGLFLTVFVDDITMAGKKPNTASMWKR